MSWRVRGGPDPEIIGTKKFPLTIDDQQRTRDEQVVERSTAQVES